MLKESMTVYQIEGAKNTFALVSDLDSKSYNHKDTKNMALLAQKICKEMSVDGCIFVYPSKELDFSWEFFNSDGSDALMCGNAARAVALWFYKNINPKKVIHFKTPSQDVKAEVLNEDTYSAGLTLGQVKVWLRQTNFVADEGTYKIYDSGVPHLCVFIDGTKIQSNDFKAIGDCYFNNAKALRYPKALNSKGSNVTYIWKDPSKSEQIYAMSFERGVENWTQACGTGAMAAAYFLRDTLNMKFPINVQMPGGVLEINQEGQQTTLTGEAKLLKAIEI